jgi:sulfate adenylyltransferase subunit 1
MPWYGGPTLLGLLETLPIENDLNRSEARFPVQYVIRPMREEYHDYRGYAGRVAGGVFHAGDAVKILPGGHTSTITSIDMLGGSLESAVAPMSVTICLADDIDISRGDMIVTGDCTPEVTQDLNVIVCWLNDKPLQVGGRYAVKHTTRDARCVVKSIDYKVNINTMEKVEGETHVGLNDIARLTIKTTVPLCVDPYRRNRDTGSLIIIDEASNVTVGAGMIE